MARLTIVFGAVLILLGLWGYFGAAIDKQSVTALIPAFFGAGLTVCGVLAINDRLLKHAMHAAATLALIGALAAGIRGLMKINVLFGENAGTEGRPIMFQLAMAVVCGLFVVLCVRSFVQVRRARQARS